MNRDRHEHHPRRRGATFDARAAWHWRALVVAALLAGCAHQTTFTSTPSGADVTIDGERVGQTPLTWSQPLSTDVERKVEVAHGEQRASFTMKQSGYDLATSAGYVGVCLGTPCAMWLGGGLIGGLGLLLGGAFAPIALVVGLPIGLIGTCCWVPGLFTGIVLAALFARAGPDAVHVDLTTSTVKGEPSDRVRY